MLSISDATIASPLRLLAFQLRHGEAAAIS